MPHRSRRHLVSLALLLAVDAGAGVAWADKEAERRADQLDKEAKMLMKEGDHAGACPKLEESQRLDRAWGTELSLSECFEGLGKLVRAREYALSAEAWAKKDSKPERQQRAHRRVEALGQRIPQLVIAVPDAVAHETGLEVKLDGEFFDRERWGTPVFLDKGDHTVRLSTPKRRWEMTVSLRTDAEKREVQIPPLEKWQSTEAAQQPPPPPPPPPATKPTAEARRPEPQPNPPSIVTTPTRDYRAPGAVFLYISALSLGTSISFRALCQGTIDELEAVCTGNHCPSYMASVASRGKVYTGLGEVTLGIGIAGIAAGAALLAASDWRKPSARSGRSMPQVRVVATAPGATLGGFGVVGEIQ